MTRISGQNMSFGDFSNKIEGYTTLLNTQKGDYKGQPYAGTLYLRADGNVERKFVTVLKNIFTLGLYYVFNKTVRLHAVAKELETLTTANEQAAKTMGMDKLVEQNNLAHRIHVLGNSIDGADDVKRKTNDSRARASADKIRQVARNVLSTNAANVETRLTQLQNEYRNLIQKLAVEKDLLRSQVMDILKKKDPKGMEKLELRLNYISKDALPAAMKKRTNAEKDINAFVVKPHAVSDQKVSTDEIRKQHSGVQFQDKELADAQKQEAQLEQELKTLKDTLNELCEREFVKFQTIIDINAQIQKITAESAELGKLRFDF